MQNTVVVINTTAGAADVVVSNRILAIKGAPNILFPNIIVPNLGPQEFLLEGDLVMTATIVEADSTTFAFNIQQYDTYLRAYVTYPISYTSVVGDTATGGVITTRLTQQINNYALAGLNVSAVKTSATVVTITAAAGYPQFSMVNVSNATLAFVTVAISACTAVNPTVITSGIHGLAIGDVVTIVSADDTKLASGTYRVATVPLTTTFTLTTLNGTTSIGATATTTGTVRKTGYPAFGSQALVQAAYAAFGGSASLVTGVQYTTLVIDWYAQTGEIIGASNTDRQRVTIYMNAAAANYAAWRTAIVNALGAVAGGVANPEVMAVV